MLISGLDLELFIEQGEYIPEISEVAGVVVTVHDPHMFPFPEIEGFLVPPGQMTYVGISKVSQGLLIKKV